MVSREEAFAILEQWEKDKALLDCLEVTPQCSMTSMRVRISVSGSEGIVLIPTREEGPKPLRFPPECKFEIRLPSAEQSLAEFGNGVEVTFPNGGTVFLSKYSER
jgi:hypothetical protein